MNYKVMNDDGARMLAAAILLKAAEDYFYVCNDNDCISDKTLCKQLHNEKQTLNALRSKKMIEMFIYSQLFDAISDISPEAFIRGVKQLRAKHNRFPTMGHYDEESKKRHRKSLSNSSLPSMRIVRKRHKRFEPDHF